MASVTCADNSTGPRSKSGLRALVGLVPAFSKAAADVYRNLVSFAIAVNNVHVRLERADGTVVVDTAIIVTPGQDSVVLRLNVPITGSEEVFEANIELRDGEQVLFAGTRGAP